MDELIIQDMLDIRIANNLASILMAALMNIKVIFDHDFHMLKG